ncbi:uncharacterized protein LOC135586337 isoform X1 [Musa acuminata AAA Group]|uniref:uncharacterized protein LOC103971386 isoform X1 n=1 Tax=Musa acuminata AAA Group TaxID=214697 RepID=UPI0031D310E8
MLGLQSPRGREGRRCHSRIFPALFVAYLRPPFSSFPVRPRPLCYCSFVVFILRSNNDVGLLRTMSTIGSLGVATCLHADKTSVEKFSKFSSLASISSGSTSSRRQNLLMQKRCNSRIRAMAKSCTLTRMALPLRSYRFIELR